MIWQLLFECNLHKTIREELPKYKSRGLYPSVVRRQTTSAEVGFYSYSNSTLTKQWQKGATATLHHVLKHDLDLAPQNDAWHFRPCCKGNTIQRVCTALELRASPLRPRHQPLMSSRFNFILYPTISWRPLPYPTDSSGSSSFVSLYFTFFNL